MSKKKNILVCPLDWGIGHASRCVPVINKLIKKGQNVIIAADRRPLAFLQQEFPTLKFIKFPGTAISYPAKNNMALKMIWSVPAILKGIIQEHQRLKRIIRQNDIDLIISDNRYGLWHHQVPSVFMTHQIHVSTGNSSFLKPAEPILLALNKFFIDKFDQCWIPDNAVGENLSGKLSHPVPAGIEAHFIGPLSRFNQYSGTTLNKQKIYDIVVIISGPEPQRSLFEEMIIKQSRNIKKRILLLGGKPGEENPEEHAGNIDYFTHLDSKQMYEYIKQCELVISRPGYSSIMDLACLKKKAVFVPTPGQTEQEYLGDYHAKKGHCICIQQKDFDLGHAIEASGSIRGFTDLTISFEPQIVFPCGLQTGTKE